MDRASSRGSRSHVSSNTPFLHERPAPRSRGVSFTRSEPPAFFAAPEPRTFAPPPSSAHVPTVVPPSPRPVVSQERRVKLGEQLAATYDLSEVLEGDKPRILALIYAVVTLEDDTPELVVSITRNVEGCYYALIFREFNCEIDVVNATRRLVDSPDPKLPPVLTIRNNPKTGSLVIRASTLSTAREDNHRISTDSYGRKRARAASVGGMN